MTSTTYFLIAIAFAIFVAAIVIWLRGAARMLFRYRGMMLFTCPETGKAAFRRERPERVVDRPGDRGPMGEFLIDHKKHEAGVSLTAWN
jgi:hypothetical protein